VASGTRVSGESEVAQSWPKTSRQTPRSARGGGWRVRERNEREDGFEFWLYFFDVSNNLAEFLSRKVTFS